MDSPSRTQNRWDSPWGEFFYQVTAFRRFVALAGGAVMGRLVSTYQILSDWAAFSLPAYIEACVLLVVIFLPQLVVVHRNRSLHR